MARVAVVHRRRGCLRWPWWSGTAVPVRFRGSRRGRWRGAWTPSPGKRRVRLRRRRPRPRRRPAPTPDDPNEQQLLAYVTERVGPRRVLRRSIRSSCPGGRRRGCGADCPAGSRRSTRSSRRCGGVRAYFATLSKDGTPQDLGRCAAEGEWYADDGDEVVRPADRAARRARGRFSAGATNSSSSRRTRVPPGGDRAELCSSWESYGWGSSENGRCDRCGAAVDALGRARERCVPLAREPRGWREAPRMCRSGRIVIFGRGAW